MTRRPRCTAKGCRRVATRRGCCEAHRRQLLRGGHLRPLRAPRPRKIEPEPESEVRLFVAPDDDDDSDEAFERRLIQQAGGRMR